MTIRAPLRVLALLAGAFAASLPAGTASADPAPRTIAMSGQGVVKAVPDTVTLSAGVTVQGISAAAALAADSTHMQAVIAALKKLGVADRNIQTQRFSVAPQYAYTNGQPPRLTGYQATNQVSVHLDDPAKLGAMLDALVAAGANQESSITFGVANPAPLLAEARAKAVADARARAETYAKAAGVTLGPILSISESGVAVPRPVLMRTMAAASFAPPAPPPIEAGEESVTADVSIVWQIP